MDNHGVLGALQAFAGAQGHGDEVPGEALDRETTADSSGCGRDGCKSLAPGDRGWGPLSDTCPAR